MYQKIGNKYGNTLFARWSTRDSLGAILNESSLLQICRVAGCVFRVLLFRQILKRAIGAAIAA